MDIHEYQCKELFRHYDVPVPEGSMAFSTEQAVSVAEKIGGDRWVVKAQIHAGGRGKAGGVKVADSYEAVRTITDQMIGSTLVTKQTGAQGKVVNRVLIEKAHNIDKEYYLGFVIDRLTQRITLIASESGGMDIEEVAEKDPSRIIREKVDPAVGLTDFQCRKIVSAINLDPKYFSSAVKLMRRLYRCFRDKDALSVEINPLALIDGEKLVALDAKMSFDGNALHRQAEITDLRDLNEEDSKEVDASAHGLNYIALDGNVGCIVNGAGLAMAAMDVIDYYGERPANFLDVGGGASPDKIANAFRIVLEDPNVKVIMLNIFAGINRCDWIAEGIVKAIKNQEINIPIIIRLAGTNVELGWEIMEKSGLKYIRAEKLDDAAQKAVAALRELKA